jgi:GTP-binding protein
MDTTYEYFVTRENLKKVFVLIDGKIPPQKLDIEFIMELVKEEIPFDIIITKIDKATQKDLNKNIKLFKQELKNKKIIEPNIFLSSSAKNKGKEQILEYIETLIS